MSEPTQEKVISIVSSLFDVSNVEVTLEHMKIKIEDVEFTNKFVDLCQRLEKMGVIGRIDRIKEETFIIIFRLPPRKKRWTSTPWIPRILFGIVVTFVMIDGYWRTEGINTSIMNIGDPLEMAGLYTLSLLGILGIHESGHMIALKMHKLKINWPYFIPGIPGGFIPTFGAIIFQKSGMAINRRILFDVAIAGPIAGLVIAIIVSVFASYTAPVIDNELAEELFEESQLIEWGLGEPIFMKATLAMFGKGGVETEVLMTPLLFAAWIGFFITFLNLLPAWMLDGGHMARTLFGAKWHRIATYATVGILMWPLNLWFMALMILFLSSRSPGVQPQDDITPLTKNRIYLYFMIIILAILCAPIPDSFSF